MKNKWRLIYHADGAGESSDKYRHSNYLLLNITYMNKRIGNLQSNLSGNESEPIQYE
jgi:hypothetical protein